MELLTFIKILERERRSREATELKKIILHSLFIILKIIQYFFLFGLVVLFPYTLELFMNQDQLFLAFILSSLHAFLIYLLLKWMSKYNISYPGSYFIYGLLSVLTIIVMITFLRFIGVTSLSKTTGTIFTILISFLPPLFFFNFDLISRFRKKHDKARKRQAYLNKIRLNQKYIKNSSKQKK